MEKLLKQFGLSQPEIMVYKSLLKSGGAKISQIAQSTNIKRTTCQEIIRALEGRGLVVAGEQGKILFYQTEDPDKLAQIINERCFVVDRLVPKLQNINKIKKWHASAITDTNAEQIIKRAERKKTITKSFKYKTINISIISDDRIILSSTDPKNPALEIISTGLVKLHQNLLKKQSHIGNF